MKRSLKQDPSLENYPFTALGFGWELQISGLGGGLGFGVAVFVGLSFGVVGPGLATLCQPLMARYILKNKR